MKTDFALSRNRHCTLLWQKAVMLMLALMATATLWAADFVIDIKLIGGSKSTVQEEIKNYKAKGWILADQDLNAGCGVASDYIYLIYKTASDTEGIPFITDFYLSDSDSDPNLGKHDVKDPPNYFTDKNGREYTLSSYRGSNHFTGSVHGNLNSNTKGDNIYLYYTKAGFPDRRAVTSIYFDNKTTGAVGKNGSSSAYDLNAGAGGDYIYMHFKTATQPDQIPQVLDINTVDDWNEFANYVNSGKTDFKDRYVRLQNNIGPVTEMVGTAEHPFRGSFFGGWYTLNVNINSTGDCAAPFSYIDGATIVRLNVTGNIIGDKHSAGLVGACDSNQKSIIEECNISTIVSSATYAGGIVGHGGHKELKLADCLFNGTIIDFSNYAGGLLGWCDDLKLTIKDCLFTGKFIPGDGGKFHPIACKYGRGTVDATIERALYRNTSNPSEGLGDNLIPGCDGTPIDYYYDFENGMEGWTLVNGSNQSGIQSEDWHTGNKGFLFEGCDKDQIIVSPELPGHGGLELYFYFHGLENQNVAFQVGTSTTTNDLDAFRWGESQTGQVKLWSVCCAEFNPGVKYIAIKYIGGSSPLYIDDICFKEGLYIPFELCANDITQTEAKLTWEGNTDQYNVRFREGPIFYENFDDSFNNNTLSWRVRNSGGNELTNWMYCYFSQMTNNLLSGHNGDIVALVGSSANKEPYAVDNWLISPEVTLDGTLSFWMMDVGNNPGHFEVLVSTITNTSTSNFEFLAEPNHGSNPYVWTEITLDLSKYKGVKGYIAFCMKDEGKDFIAIDDITIRANDWTTTTANERNILLSSLQPTTTYEYQVQGIKGNQTTAWSKVASFTTLSPVADDVNGDGTVDTQDVLGIYDFMQQWNGNTPVGKYDVNHDGIVDTQDVLELYKYIQEH